MEKAQCCWMVKSQPTKYMDDSWEEKAFAEDAAGILGGCVWPPRSYSCNFCRREFRSAQALGGHMNVHRRDRARLKQGSSFQHHDRRIDIQRNPSYCNHPVGSSLSLPSKSPPHNQRDGINDANFTFVSHPIALKPQTIYTPESQFVSSLNVNPDKNLSFFSLNNNEKGMGLPSKKISKSNEKSRSFIHISSTETVEVKKNVPNRHKKRKLDTILPQVIKMCDKVEGHTPKVDAPKIEYLDLELRLGDRRSP